MFRNLKIQGRFHLKKGVQFKNDASKTETDSVFRFSVLEFTKISSSTDWQLVQKCSKIIFVRKHCKFLIKEKTAFLRNSDESQKAGQFFRFRQTKCIIKEMQTSGQLAVTCANLT
jgi:hypothetical protein